MIFSCVSYHTSSNSVKSLTFTLVKATMQCIKLVSVCMCQVHRDPGREGSDGCYRAQKAIRPLSVFEIHDSVITSICLINETMV